MSVSDHKLELVIQNIKTYPDFPKPGILFRDIFSVMANTQASEALQDVLLDHVDSMKGKVHAVCALETRGFLFGPQIALALKVPFIPIRKRGKLPGNVGQVSYTLEYGEDAFEMQTDSLSPENKVLLVDDLLATGGSLAAACKLINSTGAQVHQCLVIMELEELNGRENVPAPVHSFVVF